MGLEALIAQESARRRAKLEGTKPGLKAIRRRRAKTLSDIEKELFDEARRLAKVHTKREAVKVALRESVRRRRADNLASAAGKSTKGGTPRGSARPARLLHGPSVADAIIEDRR
jgi:Arc/MetJ family transcription regulator